MAQKIGVLCASCGKTIEIDDDYVPGIRGAEVGASLYFYKQVKKSAKGIVAVPATTPWQKTLTCENPSCRETHTYGAADLRLYDN